MTGPAAPNQLRASGELQRDPGDQIADPEPPTADREPSNIGYRSICSTGYKPPSGGLLPCR